MEIRKYAALGCLGGGAYVGLELLWRGRSHGSMFAAGGLCFLLLGQVRRVPAVIRPVLGAAVITGVELAAGLVFNRRHQVWDYRNCPGNVLGQICPAYTLLWIPLSGIAMAVYPKAERLVQALDDPG